MTEHSVSIEATQAIAERLAADPSLRLPANLQHSPGVAVSADKRKEYLRTLLQRDPGVFLERYASKLTAAERSHFEPLRGEYEVDFYLKLAEDEASKAGSAVSATAKNRRHAQLKRLVADGSYFSDDAMRDRAPLLHHEYVGQYAPADTAKPATLSDSVMQQLESQEHKKRLQKAREEQAMVEEEEESSSDDEQDAAAAHQIPVKVPAVSTEADSQDLNASSNIPLNDRAEYQEDFLQIMQHRFLSGKDHEHVDYADIDANPALDDDWAAQADGDAQEKYFDAD